MLGRRLPATKSCLEYICQRFRKSWRVPKAAVPLLRRIANVSKTTILLGEYALRTDQNALAFVLSGCAFRAIQLLGHVSPTRSRNNPLGTACPEGLLQETWNRLVWASYTFDVFLASGVDLNSSWQSQIPRVPLPCSNRSFLAQTPEPTFTLQQDVRSEDPARFGQLELPTLMIILIRLRASVLRCVLVLPRALFDLIPEYCL